MRDWDHDGDQDYWDDVYYLENVDPYYNNDNPIYDNDINDDFDEFDEFDERDELDDDDYYSSPTIYPRSTGSTTTAPSAQVSTKPAISTNNSTSSSYRRPTTVRTSSPWGFVIMMIAILVIGAINELLGLIILCIWGYYKLMTK